MALYPFPTQRNTVIACVAIHNYLRRSGVMHIWFCDFENEEIVVQNEQNVEDNTENVEHE